MSYISGNRYLTMEEMKINAVYITTKLRATGWTDNAIAGTLANMQTESNINPEIWEGLEFGNMTGGYGLVQWTPATKYIDWANANEIPFQSMDSQLQRIYYEVAQNIQWVNPNKTFHQFTQSTDSPYDLAIDFLYSYEQPKIPDPENRGNQGLYWFEYITGAEFPDKWEIDKDFYIISSRRILPRRRTR